MDWQEVLSYMRIGQNAESIFLPEVSNADDVGPFLSAMANSKGGRIFVGVDLKNYHLTGTKKDSQWFQNITREFCRPQPNITISGIEKNEKSILVLELKMEENKPYYFKNTCYVMDGPKPKVALAEKQTLESQIEKMGAELPMSESVQVPAHTMSDAEAFQINSITDELLELQSQEDDFNDARSGILENNPLLAPQNTDNVSINDRQRKALAVVYRESSIRNKKYRELFSVSHKTAHLELIDLVDKGFIKTTGAGRSTCYVSTQQ